MNGEEYKTINESIQVRIFSKTLEEIDEIIARDKGEHWETRSQFIRSAVQYFIASDFVKKIIYNGGENNDD